MNTSKKKKRKVNKSKLNSKKNLFKGFTLTELLAVIIILAVLLIIAVPSVTSILASAKEKTFKEYAEKIVEETAKSYMKDTVEDTADSCHEYYITDFGLDNTGDYDGYVLAVTSETEQIYYVTMWDSEHYIKEVNFKNLDSVKWSTIENEDDINEAKAVPFPTVKSLYDMCDNVEEDRYFSGEQEQTNVTKSSSSITWTAKYKNGKMVACYISPGEYNFNTWNGANYYNISGGETYYCAGYTSTKSGDLVVTPFEEPSLECCTAPKKDPNDSSKQYVGYIVETGQIGNFAKSGTSPCIFSGPGGDMPKYKFD